MAAAEYFSNKPMAPTSSPQRPYVQTQAPPPYQETRPGVHFAPTPVELSQRHSFSGQQRPSISSSPQPQYNQPYYQQPPNQPYPQNNMLVPHRPSQQYGYATPPSNSHNTPPNPQYLNPNMRPYSNPNTSQYSLAQTGYSSDPEPHRRRHEHQHQHHSTHSRRDSDGTTRDGRRSKPSRSTNADAFVAAAGGGLIGDLIFPGLGTVGGAALGWLGGKDYAHNRKDREDKRGREQRKWEEKFRPELRRGDRSRGSEEDWERRRNRY